MFSIRDTENIRKYRLSHSELNMVLHQIALRYDSKNAPQVSKDKVEGFHLIYAQGKKFIICPMSKDAETKDNEEGMPFIWDTIDNALKKEAVKDSLLLIPMRLCRGYFNLPTYVPMVKRKHAVLLILHLINNAIYIHDSQGWVKQYCYPDKINQYSNEKKFDYDYSINYHAYNKQDDAYSCGYYVVEYIESILKTGSVSGCTNIQLNIKEKYSDKSAYLKGYEIEIGPTIASSDSESFDNQEAEDEFEKLFIK
ncbi:MAG: hypothetical protein A3F14_01325 [Gammaproteobacteria bacterium RIFCSPHIGHO2_12_FULL_43_28]|nr:MAG: hypothetical protein A3F14_01325 [Gammaproteobacteria bacterium RIFCSPHIGHO2_12_FULL_43_28]